jgi:hypothetical protein
MQINNTSRLTDTLERELLAHAMQEQSSSHPIRSLGKLFNELASFTASARAKAKINQMV